MAGKCPFHFISRRKFLGVAGVAAAAGAGYALHGGLPSPLAGSGLGSKHTEPFYGDYQSGILTPTQASTYFASFDVISNKRDDLIEMLQKWTDASARMTKGHTPDDVEPPDEVTTHDSGETLDLAASRLTITFGFGPSLFVKEGHDRFGINHLRPEALPDMPAFSGDQLAPEKTGGDISVQACSDDPQVAFHAVRQLARLAGDTAQLRWTQAGFMSTGPDEATPRNLMGFKDGTANPKARDHQAMEKVLWAGSEGPAWMVGGTYLVARRIRVALEHWDRMKVAFQEQTIGRKKISGAPLGRQKEFDTADLSAVDQDGNPIIPENSHLRLANASNNDGAQIFRRPYSYNDGTNFTAERWPPWRQAMEYDAGLLFICYQRDPRTGFIKIFDKMSKFDMLNQFATHVGGGLFACPPGAKDGEYIGQKLFTT